MEASARLRTLAPWNQWREYMNADVMDLIEGDDMERLLNVLPLIIDVIEAAEKSWWLRYANRKSKEFIENGRILSESIAKLNEALSDN